MRKGRWYHILGAVLTLAIVVMGVWRFNLGLFDKLKNILAASKTNPAFQSFNISEPDLIFIIAFLLIGFWAFQTAYSFFIDHSPKAVYATAITGVLIVISSIGFWLFLENKYGNAVTIVGIGLATLGWLHQSNATRIANRKQHTLNILMEMRQCDIVIKQQQAVNKKIPHGKPLSKEEAFDLEKEYRSGEKYIWISPPLSWSLSYLLNYYEFISAGVIHGDIDNDFLSNTHKSAIVGLYNRAFHFIRLQWTLEKLEDGKKIFTAENLPKASTTRLLDAPLNKESPYFMLYHLVEIKWKKRPTRE